MASERVRHPEEIDDDVVIVDTGSGSSTGVVLAIIAVLIVLTGVWWFALGPGA